ncbi:hypothetical protein ACP_1140 [Acidobacterium capsulatum ATCC 51196]|uniref:Uncharacterized protein n=1 Tax=Acidobacterium capsulatum (strain ATCC 51196 / DSM 11244 / BCRC 80197 / JCM 7670 / NBRC 15755 / NCIMB 13165 / 161) TaxID=240015 RepID=C1F4M5_ACIC5|nr:hypothetical protein ACP_1140 [Acidobacterium capsulatum ATCC 51196]
MYTRYDLYFYGDTARARIPFKARTTQTITAFQRG